MDHHFTTYHTTVCHWRQRL